MYSFVSHVQRAFGDTEIHYVCATTTCRLYCEHWVAHPALPPFWEHLFLNETRHSVFAWGIAEGWIMSLFPPHPIRERHVFIVKSAEVLSEWPPLYSVNKWRTAKATPGIHQCRQFVAQTTTVISCNSISPPDLHFKFWLLGHSKQGN